VGPFVSTFVECFRRNSAKEASLTSVGTKALSKEALSVLKCAFFVECYGHNTRQSDQKAPFYLFLLLHPNKQKIYIIDITYISQNQNMYHQHHISHKYHHIKQVSQTYVSNTHKLKSQVSHKVLPTSTSSDQVSQTSFTNIRSSARWAAGQVRR
jgi:hypothetical protein